MLALDTGCETLAGFPLRDGVVVQLVAWVDDRIRAQGDVVSHGDWWDRVATWAKDASLPEFDLLYNCLGIFLMPPVVHRGGGGVAASQVRYF